MKSVSISRYKLGRISGKLGSLMRLKQVNTTATTLNLLISLKSSGRALSSSAVLFKSVMASSLLSMGYAFGSISLGKKHLRVDLPCFTESQILCLRVLPSRECYWPFCVGFNAVLPALHMLTWFSSSGKTFRFDVNEQRPCTFHPA